MATKADILYLRLQRGEVGMKEYIEEMNAPEVPPITEQDVIDAVNFIRKNNFGVFLVSPEMKKAIDEASVQYHKDLANGKR